MKRVLVVFVIGAFFLSKSSAFTSNSPSNEEIVHNRVEIAVSEARVAIRETHKHIKEIEDELIAARSCGQSERCLLLSAKRLLLKSQLVLEPLKIGLQTELKVASPSLSKKETKSIGIRLLNKLTQSVQVLNFHETRTDPVVLFDFAKRYGVVATFQLLGFMANAVSTPHFLDNAPYFIFPNTLVMMLLQTEVGARHTPRELNISLPEDHDDLYSQIPAMLTGLQGFKSAFKERFLGFAKLWPLEWTVITMANTIQLLLQEGGGGIEKASLIKMAFVNAGFTTVFGAYLALRWSLWDKVFELRFLPALSELEGREFNSSLNSLKKEHGIPEQWSGWGIKEFFDVFIPASSAATSSGTRAHCAALLRHFATGGMQNKFHQYCNNRASYREFMKLAELRELRRSPAYWSSMWARTREMGYRYTIGFTDAYVVFGLVGSWLPSAFDRVYEFLSCL